MDRLLLLQAILYFVIFILGLTTSISSGVARDHFGGVCVLYGKASCSNSNETSIAITAGHKSICTFIPTGNLIFGVLFAFCAFCYHVYYVHRSKIIVRAPYNMCLKMLCFAAVLATFVTIVAGGALTVGLADWCSSVDAVKCENGTLIQSCWDTQKLDIDWVLSESPGQKVFAGNYFYEYSVAEVTCWLSVVVWLMLLSICIYRLVKQSKLQNSYQDPFVMDTADAFS